jgi:hypothetical protein
MFISYKLVRNFKFSAKNLLTLIIQSMDPVEYFDIYIYIYIYVWKLNQTVLELDYKKTYK